MANLNRRIGNNIYTSMKDNKISSEILAERMEYSIKDVWSIIEGKVMLPPSELEKIAGVLNTTKERLIDDQSDRLVPNLEFMHDFSNPDNLDKGIDLMDEYVEIYETVK